MKGIAIRIGLLIPYSGTHPQIGEALERSIRLAFAQIIGDEPIECIAEFIQGKDIKEIENLVLKLYQFSRVDVIIGVLGNKSFPLIIPIAERYQKPFIAINLGGDIPRKDIVSPYLLYNSFYAWQSAFSLGKWAQQRFGGIPGAGISVYEAGYDLHAAFVAGITVSGAKEYKRTFLPFVEKGYDTSGLIHNWLEDTPGYGFALLSGNEATQFLQLFKACGLKEKLPLLVNYFMVEENNTTLAENDTADLPIVYTAAGWLSSLPNEATRNMVSLFQQEIAITPGVYDLLAYEVGLVLSNYIKENPKMNHKELTAHLNTSFALGPRENICLSTVEKQQNKNVYVLEATVENGKWKHTLLREEKAIEWNDPAIDESQLVLAGWHNAYLCV